MYILSEVEWTAGLQDKVGLMITEAPSNKSGRREDTRYISFVDGPSNPLHPTFTNDLIPLPRNPFIPGLLTHY